MIAREWRYLDPVRAFCEVHHIPVHMGREEIPRFWRLRETRALVAWLRGRESRLVDTAALRAWLEARPPGPWITLLGEAVDDYAFETGGAAMPVSHCIEWLAEWGREARQRQRGLLLLTAHSAKGLEFDHVAVLDGGWGRSTRGEDPDASRRLYYVAMTRARQTLLLVHFAGPPKTPWGTCTPCRMPFRTASRWCPVLPTARCRTRRRLRASIAVPVWTRSIWALPGAPPLAIRCIAPLPPCRLATR